MHLEGERQLLLLSSARGLSLIAMAYGIVSTLKKPTCTSCTCAVETTMKRALRQHLTIRTQENQPCFAQTLADGLITKCKQNGTCFSECERDFSEVDVKCTFELSVLGEHVEF